MDFATHRYGWHGPERQRVRLVAAVTLSLLIHAFILSLQFGIPGFGLPGLSLPWQQPRGQALELHLLPGKAAETAASAEAVPPMPAPEAAIAQLRVPHRRRPRPTKPHAVKPDAVSTVVAAVEAAPAPLPQVAKAPSASADADSVAPPVSHVETPQPDLLSLPEPAPQPPAQPPIIASTQPHGDAFTVPPAAPAEMESQPPQLTSAVPDTIALPEPAQIKAEQPAPTPTQTEAVDETDSSRRAQELAAAQQAQDVAAALALQQQALAEQQREQQERALEAQRQAEEAARQQAAALALQEQMLAAQKREEEAARREREAMQLEEQKREQQAEAEREALKLQMEAEAEARRRAEESARLQEQARRQQEAEQLAARRRAEAEAEARANAEALRQKELERESLVAAPPAANAPAGNGESSAPPLVLPGRGFGDLASRALAQARNPDLLREPAPAGRSGTANAENPRRRSIFGRIDADVGLAMYVEGWRLKIERNGRLNYRQSLVETAYTEPIVTVAVRSDGSVEEIIINRSSGRPELDEAVRRIIRLNARYGAFPPELARRYDVIEIRRVWNFDDRLKLLEEVR
jgi:TonB family protein